MTEQAKTEAPAADAKDALAGKTFMLTRIETELLEERYGRAAELDARAQELAAKAEYSRRHAAANILGHALERIGAPADREVEWLMKDGMPAGFTIAAKKPAKS